MTLEHGGTERDDRDVPDSLKVMVMAGTMRVPRTRGAISGFLLMLLGAWGALIPFIGPYFDFAYSPDSTWHYTNGRLILEILPGACVFLGGLLTLGSSHRLVAMFGGWLAAVGGAWFVVGLPLSTLWGSPTVGAPLGSSTRQTFEYIAHFGGLGAVSIFFAALAIGRLAVVGVRDAARAERRAAAYDSDGAYDDTAYGDTGVSDSGDEDTSGHHFPWHRSRHVGAH